MDAFAASGGRAIVRAVSDGTRGHPVIPPRSVFADLLQLEGDVGARHVTERSGLEVIELDIEVAPVPMSIPSRA